MKTAFKIFQYILFVLLMIGELVVFIAVIDSSHKRNDVLDKVLTIDFAVSFAVLMLISVGGVIRLIRGHRRVLASNMLMRLFVAAILVFVSLVPAKDDSGGKTVIFFISVPLILAIGVGAAVFGRRADKLRPKKPKMSKEPGTVVRESFTCDKAEWAWEQAAAEYYHGKVPEDISDSDNDKIYMYAGMPIASYLCWLLQRDLVDGKIYELVPPELIEDVKQRRTPPTALLECLDHVLSKDIIAEEALSFTEVYYWDEYRRSSFSYPHSIYSEYYYFDYYDTFADGNELYVNEFSNEKQIELEKLIDKRYLKFNERPFQDFRHIADVQSDVFGSIIVKAREQVSPSYTEACVKQITSPDTALADKLRKRINAAREEYGDRQNPVTAFIFPPEGDEIAYMVLFFGSDRECGFAITVRGDYVSEAVPEEDCDFPWSIGFERKLLLEYADPNDTCKMYLVPTECGGSEGADNYVAAPRVIAELKAKSDRRVICMVRQGIKLSYKCEPEYSGSKVTGVTILAEMSDGKKRYFDYIKLPCHI